MTERLTIIDTENCKFLGIHQGQEPEKARYYFLIKAMTPYTALNGSEVSYFIVYTSSGANSEKYNIPYNIYPMFGVMNLLSSDNRITPVLLKNSHYNLSYTRSMMGSNEGTETLFTAGEQIIRKFKSEEDYEYLLELFPSDLINTYFGSRVVGEEGITGDFIEKYQDFLHRMGSVHFLRPIVENLETIKIIHDINIDKIPREYIKEDLSFLNRNYGMYNFYGIDLRRAIVFNNYLRDSRMELCEDLIKQTSCNEMSGRITSLRLNQESYHKIPWSTILNVPIEYDVVRLAMCDSSRSCEVFNKKNKEWNEKCKVMGRRKRLQLHVDSDTTDKTDKTEDRESKRQKPDTRLKYLSLLNSNNISSMMNSLSLDIDPYQAKYLKYKQKYLKLKNKIQ